MSNGINCNPDCTNKNCEGGIITFDGKHGRLCKFCNPEPYPLPCPFCGTTPSASPTLSTGEYDIECRQITCLVNPSFSVKMKSVRNEGEPETWHYDTKEASLRAIKWWNKREPISRRNS